MGREGEIIAERAQAYRRLEVSAMNPWVPAALELQSLLARSLPTLLLLSMLAGAMTLLHELAHAVIARLLGLRVFAICCGRGKLLLSLRFLGTRLDLRYLPLGGHTILGGPPSPLFRLRLFLSILAGPALHLLALLVFAPFSLAPRLRLQAPVAAELAFAGIALNLLLLAGNLWPHRSQYAYGKGPNDGLWLLKLLFPQPGETDDFFATYYVQEAVNAYELGDYEAARRWAHEGVARYPDSAITIGGLGVILLQLGEPGQARALFARALAADDRANAQARAIRLNNVAYADVAIGDPALLAEADSYSAEAYAILSQVPAIMGTRGAALVELGRVDEGITLLRQALAGHADAASRALVCCHLALGEKRRGNLAAARQHLEAARAHDPRCFLIARAAGEPSSAGGALQAAGSRAALDGEDAANG